jgi:hypothetical protein
VTHARVLAAALVVLALPGPALAQDGTATGSASASVIRPLAATAVEDLSFGAITVGATASGGTVAVPPNGGGASYAGSVRQLCSGGGQYQPHPARFAVSGEAGRTYRVTLPAGIVALGQRGGTGLDVTGMVLHSANRGSTTGGQLDAGGEDSFAVGGTLQVPAGTPADLYRAQFPVTVSYD